MPTTPTPLLRLWWNGKDTFFARCHWCTCDVIGDTRRDDLALLAEAKRRGWRIQRMPSGEHSLCCPECARIGMPMLKAGQRPV